MMGHNVLVADAPRAGKSWVSGLLCAQLILTSGIIRARARCCFFLRPAKTRSAKVQCSVVSGSVGS